MYKLLLFLNKTNEEQVVNHFNDYTVRYLSEITGRQIEVANVESNLLLEQKFSKFCEAYVDSKEVWDKLMQSKPGRELNLDLMEFHKFITVIFVDYKN